MDVLAKSNQSYLMCFDVTPLSLGWESYGEDMYVVILENMHIPITMKMKRVTTDDNHSFILFKVFQGEKASKELETKTLQRNQMRVLSQFSHEITFLHLLAAQLKEKETISPNISDWRGGE